MGNWKIKNFGFTTVELLVAVSFMGIIAIISINLLSSKAKNSNSAIVRTRELTDIISNLRLLKNDIVNANSISRDATSNNLVITINLDDSGIPVIRTITYKRIKTCNYGRGERVGKKEHKSKRKYQLKNGNFYCLQRIVEEDGHYIKSLSLNAIKDLKWCLTSENCDDYLDMDANKSINSPPTNSSSMVKLQVYDYKGTLIKMILGLTNMGSNHIPRMDIMHIN